MNSSVTLAMMQLVSVFIELFIQRLRIPLGSQSFKILLNQFFVIPRVTLFHGLDRADMYAIRVRQLGTGGVAENPNGPDRPWDPREPRAPSRVNRGGSFLCHISYCESYRPGARRGTAADTGMSHVGFRCVMTREAWNKRREASTEDGS